jgi:ribosomal protein S18 acetylase RimI-like enzyme
MELNYRILNKSDIDLLLDFMRQFYAIDEYPFHQRIARAAVEKMVSDPSLGRIWLIDRDSEPIGYLVLTFSYSLEFHGRDAFIDELFILAEYRNQGIGKRVMEFVLDACRELGITALHLEVERGNSAGQALYRKFGFKDHDRYLMTRWISKREE